MFRAVRFGILAVAFSVFGLVTQASAQVVAFAGQSSVEGFTRKRAVNLSFSIDSVRHRSSPYTTPPLAVRAALCNRAYNPDTAGITKCTYIATKKLEPLPGSASHTNISFATQGFKKVKPGRYRIVLLLSDDPVTGLYDWKTFPGRIVVKK